MSSLAFALALLALAVSGCSTFVTDQTDRRYNEDGTIATEIRTKAKSRAFFDSDSALTSFTATQTEKSQSAKVGSLTQEARGTNVVDTIKALGDLVGKIPR